jgi:hypothetical protein
MLGWSAKRAVPALLQFANIDVVRSEQLLLLLLLMLQQLMLPSMLLL